MCPHSHNWESHALTTAMPQDGRGAVIRMTRINGHHKVPIATCDSWCTFVHSVQFGSIWWAGEELAEGAVQWWLPGGECRGALLLLSPRPPRLQRVHICVMSHSLSSQQCDEGWTTAVLCNQQQKRTCHWEQVRPCTATRSCIPSHMNTSIILVFVYWTLCENLGLYIIHTFYIQKICFETGIFKSDM